MLKLMSIYSFLLIVCLMLIAFVYILEQEPPKAITEDKVKLPPNVWTGWSPSLTSPLVTVVCSGAVSKLERPALEKIYVDLKRQKEQIRVMLGTLLYFSHSAKWLVYIVTDTQATFDIVTDSLATAWPKEQYQRFDIRRRGIKMPKDKNITKLLYHYRPCAWQKLFLNLIFPDYDSLVFMDSDVLFTGKAENLWKEFSKFNAIQAIGASPEPWYIKDDNWPYAGKLGINTGVITFNLTRLKNIPHGGFGYATAKELTELKDPRFAPRHDQDMVNILLRKYPKFLYEMEYKWNFIPSDCSEYAPPCESCIADGLTVIHGADAVFYRNVDQRYRILYYIMEKMTKTLTTPPRDLLLIYEGGMNAIHSFSYADTICSGFDSFLALTTHSLRKMISSSI